MQLLSLLYWVFVLNSLRILKKTGQKAAKRVTFGQSCVTSCTSARKELFGHQKRKKFLKLRKLCTSTKVVESCVKVHFCLQTPVLRWLKRHFSQKCTFVKKKWTLKQVQKSSYWCRYWSLQVLYISRKYHCFQYKLKRFVLGNDEFSSKRVKKFQSY